MKNIKLRIGNIELPSFAVLPPLAGYSDISFRKICAEMGAGMTTTEMINVNALVYDNEKTEIYLETVKGDHIESVQLFGHDTSILKKAIIEYINPREDFQFLDLNFGCPAPKIVKNGDGSALMKDPYLAVKFAETAVKFSNKPVTCKMRLGFNRDNENFLEIGKGFENIGVSAITLHARFREDFYEGEANWEKIAELQEHVNIPVIGNGDIETAEEAFKMIEETNCKGVAIGRGAIGNPWIFKDLLNLNNGGEKTEVDAFELWKVISMHYEDMRNVKGEYAAIREMRKHLSKYFRGIPGASGRRAELMTMDDYDEVLRNIKYFITRER